MLCSITKNEQLYLIHGLETFDTCSDFNEKLRTIEKWWSAVSRLLTWTILWLVPWIGSSTQDSFLHRLSDKRFWLWENLDRCRYTLSSATNFEPTSGNLQRYHRDPVQRGLHGQNSTTEKETGNFSDVRTILKPSVSWYCPKNIRQKYFGDDLRATWNVYLGTWALQRYRVIARSS